MIKIITSGIKGNIGKSFNKNYNLIPYDKNSSMNGNIFLHLASKRFGTANDYIESNILYLTECIEYCKLNNIKNFVFFSAMSVYGDINRENVNENTFFNNPNLYGISKLFGEQLLKESNLNVLIIRAPMVLTNNQDIGILNRVRKELLLNNDIHITNYDKVFNNFIHANDLLNFIVSYKFSTICEVFNIAVDKTHTLYEIILYMKNFLSSDSRLIKDDKKTNFFNIDISKFKQCNIQTMNVEESLKRWLNEFNTG